MRKSNIQNNIPDFASGLFDSSRNTADMAVEAVGNDSERFAHLLDICFTSSYPLNMRASRVAELACEKYPSLILPYIDEVIKKISVSKTEGVKRNFLKIIAEFIDFKLVKDNTTLIQISFDWLASAKESVSVRYYCISIVEKLCYYEPDFKTEFKAVLEFSLDEASAGLRNKSLKVLKKLSN